jgi:hypothetical protein
MLNAIDTSSALEGVNDSELVVLIVKNGEQMLEYYVEWRKRGKSDNEFGELLGISAKTVKNRYLATARKQGLIEASKHSNDAAQRTAQNRALPKENSSPIPAEPEMAPINLSTYVQPEEFIQPERTSEIYNFLSTQLSELNDVIYSNHGNFSDDEYRSLCGTAYHIYVNLRTKCDHLERLERNRTESFTIDATQV